MEGSTEMSCTSHYTTHPSLNFPLIIQDDSIFIGFIFTCLLIFVFSFYLSPKIIQFIYSLKNSRKVEPAVHLGGRDKCGLSCHWVARGSPGRPQEIQG